MLLSDHIFSPSMRYESHRLYISRADGEDEFVFGGFLGAALAAVFLVDTPEGDARGIRLYTDDEKDAFFALYDREVLRDDWGYLSAEIGQLRDNYVQFIDAPNNLIDLFPNRRLLTLVTELLTTYMRRLVLEPFGEHIWEAMPWKMPFAQWLIDAARVETRRQRLLQTDWTDIPTVIQLADIPDETEEPTFFFEGEKAADIMQRYLQWLSDEYVAMKQGIPGSKITSADRSFIFSQETDWAFLSDELATLDPEDQASFRRWMTEWEGYLTAQLHLDPPKPQRKDLRQELFLDEVTPAPAKNDYVGACQYIRERSKYDENFKNYVSLHERTVLCDQLTFIFGWPVDPNSLGKRMNYKPKYYRKNHLK